MFFFIPLSPLLAIYILAALLPALILLRYVYRHDTIEKEPMSLLAGLVLLGVAAALASMVLENVGEGILNLFAAPGGRLHTLLLAFLVVAAAEEGTKLVLLKRATWRHPAFNYRFDGVVYAVFVSLGFAAFENILYVFHYGLSVALPRALLAVPGHMSFAVFQGVFYGRAKVREREGDRRGAGWSLRAGYLLSVFLHGTYDACAMLEEGWSVLVFLGFVAVMFFCVFRTLKRESAADVPL